MPSFWFVMSMGLIVGSIAAYPMNWWLVTYHLKHGMMMVGPAGAAAGARGHEAQASIDDSPRAGSGRHIGGGEAPRPPVPVMILLSFLAFAAGAAIALLSRQL